MCNEVAIASAEQVLQRGRERLDAACSPSWAEKCGNGLGGFAMTLPASRHVALRWQVSESQSAHVSASAVKARKWAQAYKASILWSSAFQQGRSESWLGLARECPLLASIGAHDEY